MATASLSASTRPGTGKGVARTLRRNGQVPGVIYGHAREAQAIAVPTRELERLLEKIEAGSTVIELAIDGKQSRTLIREIQRHPFKRELLHIDFQELVAGEKVTVKVPLVLVGTAEGVRLSGGIMDQPLRELEIEVDPAAIPNHIDVDISALTLGASIHVRDLKIAAGIEVLTDADATICVCAAPRAAVEAAATESAAPAEPEVIRAKKAEDEEPAKK